MTCSSSAITGSAVAARPFVALVALFVLCGSPRTVSAEPPTEIAPVERPPQFEGPQVQAQTVQASSYIRVSEARHDFGVSGEGKCAAVLDTGINSNHVDFGSRIKAARNFTTADGGDPAIAVDRNGHGSNVAGILMANADHIGMAPSASVVALKVLRDDGSGSFADVEKALQWVLDNRIVHGISVVSMSLGAETNDSDDASTASLPLRAKIRDLRAAGVVVVVAAGNAYHRFKAQGMGYPAIFRETTSVGAVYDSNVGGQEYLSGAEAFRTEAGQLCPFSQRLTAIPGSAAEFTRTDLFAPGAPITSTGHVGPHGWTVESGTSQATPVVAGVALLVQQYYEKQTGRSPSVDDVERYLRSGSATVSDDDSDASAPEDNVPNTGARFPRIDAYGALRAVQADLATQILRQGTKSFKELDLTPAGRAKSKSEYGQKIKQAAAERDAAIDK